MHYGKSKRHFRFNSTVSKKTEAKEDVPKIGAIVKDGLNAKLAYEEILKNVLKHHPESKMKIPCGKTAGYLNVRNCSLLYSLANPAASCWECARYPFQQEALFLVQEQAWAE